MHWDSYNGGYGVGWGIISMGNAGKTGKVLSRQKHERPGVIISGPCCYGLYRSICFASCRVTSARCALNVWISLGYTFRSSLHVVEGIIRNDAIDRAVIVRGDNRAIRTEDQGDATVVRGDNRAIRTDRDVRDEPAARTGKGSRCRA